MKKKPYLFTASAVALFAGSIALHSCTKLVNNLQRDLEMETTTVEMVIPPVDTTVAFTGAATNYYNVDSFIKASTANVLGINNITSAKIASCQITIDNPSTANNFANFKSCSASFHTNAKTDPYTVSVANNPDVYATSLNLPVDTSADIRTYFNGNQFSYSLNGALRRATTDSLRCKMVVKFRMRVQG